MFRERSKENLAQRTPNEDAVVLVDDLIVHASAVPNTRIPLVNTINHRPACGQSADHMLRLLLPTINPLLVCHATILTRNPQLLPFAGCRINRSRSSRCS